MSGDRHVAVANGGSNCVSVFSVGGDFIRHVGVGALRHPVGTAVSAFDELVVVQYAGTDVWVFTTIADDPEPICARSMFTGVALHGGTVFLMTRDGWCLTFC
jgi:hypothetical protein